MGMDKERDKRITYEIIVDCYGEYEVAACWYCYLEDVLNFPFKARCIKTRSMSPLNYGETVNVLSLTDQDDCEHEMFVIIELFDRQFGVPLAQLQPLDADAKTVEAVEDWRYWLGGS